jgi:hypothetical protein
MTIKDDPNKQKPGESIRDFMDRRRQDPEYLKKQAERDREDFRRRSGLLQDDPSTRTGAVGTSGLGGTRRRRK